MCLIDVQTHPALSGLSFVACIYPRASPWAFISWPFRPQEKFGGPIQVCIDFLNHASALPVQPAALADCSPKSPAEKRAEHKAQCTGHRDAADRPHVAADQER